MAEKFQIYTYSITANNATRINITLNSLDFNGTTPGAIKVTASGVLGHPSFVGTEDDFVSNFIIC